MGWRYLDYELRLRWGRLQCRLGLHAAQVRRHPMLGHLEYRCIRCGHTRDMRR